VITVARVVTDAPFVVDDQCVDLRLSEARCNRKPCLAFADNKGGRLAADIFSSGFSEVEPVGPPKIARIDLALRTGSPELLFVPLDFVERCEQRPRLQGAAIANIGGQPQNAVAAALSCFKSEDRFNRVGARAGNMARRDRDLS
jgi:hypothetical protein